MPITIVPFRADLAPAFAALNRAWIEKFFALEESDWKVLRNPQTGILDNGGQIWFAMDGDTPIGTVAALHMETGKYELAKMAVDPAYQGRGIGEQLGETVIDWARNRHARLLVLETNRKLDGAIRLYGRLGFVHATPPAPSDYARADVYMELDLSHITAE